MPSAALFPTARAGAQAQPSHAPQKEPHQRRLRKKLYSRRNRGSPTSLGTLPLPLPHPSVDPSSRDSGRSSPLPISLRERERERLRLISPRHVPATRTTTPHSPSLSERRRPPRDDATTAAAASAARISGKKRRPHLQVGPRLHTGKRAGGGEALTLPSLKVEQQPVRARMCGFGDKVGKALMEPSPALHRTPESFYVRSVWAIKLTPRMPPRTGAPSPPRLVYVSWSRTSTPGKRWTSSKLTHPNGSGHPPQTRAE